MLHLNHSAKYWIASAKFTLSEWDYSTHITVCHLRNHNNCAVLACTVLYIFSLDWIFIFQEAGQISYFFPVFMYKKGIFPIIAKISFQILKFHSRKLPRSPIFFPMMHSSINYMQYMLLQENMSVNRNTIFSQNVFKTAGKGGETLHFSLQRHTE